MQKLKWFLFRTPAALMVGLLAFLNPFLFYLSIDFHGCFSDVVPGVDIVMRVLQVLCAVGILALLFVLNLGKGDKLIEKKWVTITYLVLACLTMLFFIANFVILIMLSSGIPMARYYFEKEAPYLLILGFILSMGFVIPRLNTKTKVIIMVAVYVACGVLLLAVDWWHLEPFDFCTQPIVFDTGKDYSIVWSTTDISQGYVAYTYDNENYEVASAANGRMYSNRIIHHANVPYEHLDGNTYTVYATRCLDNAPYFSARGKTVTATVSFLGKPAGDIQMAVVTDNHCLSRAKVRRMRKEDYNCVVMLGDFSDFVHQELDIADFLLYPAWHLSGGQVPVLYAKGNHDTHCEMGGDLAYLLGFDRLYYQTTYGDYTFTVLDSGSCNVDLEGKKYGYVGRYIPYRDEELDWMSTLTPSAGYDISIVHVWDFASVAEGIHNDEAAAQVVRYNNCLADMGVTFQLSGHKHDFKFLSDGADGIDVPILRCGGVQGGLVGHTLTYGVVRISDGVLQYTAYNTSKDQPLEQGQCVLHK